MHADGEACDPPQIFKINLSRKVRLGATVMLPKAQPSPETGTLSPSAEQHT